jgi:predicted DsbA family dithiol-disulfide isomerase
MACVGVLGFPAVAQIQGDYERIGAVPNPNTAQTVLFEEYLNFTCPHCNNFRQAAADLKAKFGKRLNVTYIPVLFRGQNDAMMRLFFIAQREGKEHAALDALFDAAFRYGVNLNDPAVINYLARSMGLGEAYERDYNAPWVNAKLNESLAKADQAGITATPTVVLQGSIRVLPRGGMSAFVGNLEQIISQLLAR